VVLKANNPWAADTGKTKGGLRAPGLGAISIPPYPRYLQDYYDFVANVVERYDGDGHWDMPGLKYPVLYYEIESEAQHEGFWRGTAKDYGVLLRLAHNAAKEACPDSQIILSGINFGEWFDQDSSTQELKKQFQRLPLFHRKAFEFVSYTLSLVDYYDAIEFHYNRDYRGVFGTVKYLRSELKKYGQDKPIWAGDTASTTWLFAKRRSSPIPYRDEQLYRKLLDPQHQFSDEVKWFRAEQAKISIKKHIVGAGERLAGIILETLHDWWPQRRDLKYAHEKNWQLTGLINKDRSPRPVYYAYKQMIDHLNGFNEAVRLRSAREDYLYRFSFSTKPPIYVIWTEKGQKEIEIKTQFGELIQEAVIDDMKGQLTKKKHTTSGGFLRIKATDRPVYLYKGK
jgi:hypothetical protein